MEKLSFVVTKENSYSLPKIQAIVDSIEDGVIIKDLENNKKRTIEYISLIKLLISLPLFILSLFINNNLYLKIILLGLSYIVAGYSVLYRAFKKYYKRAIF